MIELGNLAMVIKKFAVSRVPVPVPEHFKLGCRLPVPEGKMLGCRSTFEPCLGVRQLECGNWSRLVPWLRAPQLPSLEEH